MRLLACISVLVVTFVAADVSACEPIDAPVALYGVDGDFVFVTNHTLVRVRPPGTVVFTRDLEFVTETFLMADGVHVLNVVGVDGSGETCMPMRYRFDMVDIRRGGGTRVLGTFPSHTSLGSDIHLHARSGAQLTFTIESLMDDGETEEYERVDVSTTRARSRRLRASPAAVPASPRAAHDPLTMEADDDNHRLLLRNGANTVVTVQLRDEAGRVVTAMLSEDGRHLALSTYEDINEDYGTGFSARLDIVDLQTGTVTTPYGESSGVSEVRGRVGIQCDRVVRDPGSSLNVRAGPRRGARVVGAIPDGTTVVLGERRGRWRQVRQPVAGWAWADNFESRCRVR